MTVFRVEEKQAYLLHCTFPKWVVLKWMLTGRASLLVCHIEQETLIEAPSPQGVPELYPQVKVSLELLTQVVMKLLNCNASGMFCVYRCVL